MSPPDWPGTRSVGGSGYEDAVERQEHGSDAEGEPEVSNQPQVKLNSSFAQYHGSNSTETELNLLLRLMLASFPINPILPSQLCYS